MDALGQLFYSLSVAMGILVAYGSYMPDDADLNKSVNQIEIFDTLVAFLAGVMIIPAVYVFLGKEGMSGGPSLMFMTLPKVFMQMGTAGNVVGALFFAMVLFAAVTSGMSVLEAVVSSFIDKTKMSRSTATVVETLLALIIGVVVCFGYNIFKFEVKLPNGASAQILDILDYISNNIFMPIVAIATCILIGWVVKPKMVMDEATKNGEKFGRKGLYVLMVKYVAPVLLIALLLMAMGIIKL
jgi:NSS family neurotransmitter:Na+ symporter